jgi:acyl-lipid omega-6 desaturase (Delta-12 desaturase)
MVELVLTAGLFVLLWMLMWEALDVSYWLCLALAVPGAGFLVRLFMIQHDCGHGSFFRNRLANDWVGRAIGVLTLSRMISGDARMPSTTRALATSSAAGSAISIR